MDVNIHDWKLFKEKLPEWQERYMDKLEKEYVQIILNGDKLPSEKFWELKKAIDRDKKSPGVGLELRKSEMEIDIMLLLKDKAISIEDLNDFSNELLDRIKSYIE